MREGRGEGRALALLFACAVLCAVVRRAFVTDDAYITFRTVDNLIHGYGATWNVAERVQTYTSPLWMLLVSIPALFTREVYVTGLTLEFATTAITVYLVVTRVAVDMNRATLCVGLLFLSKAFIDYSTSGLENSLGHALLAAFAAVHFRRDPSLRSLLWLTLFASLAVVNRIDMVLLVGLPLALRLVASVRANGSRATARVVALGSTPLLAWCAFALFYYGAIIPNSGRAKLTTGIPIGDMMEMGMYYIANSLRLDPLTIATIVIVFVLGSLRENRWLLPLAAGALLDSAYVLWIGGDHMSGRFFSLPFVMAVAVIGQMESFESPRLLITTAGASVLLAAMGGFSSLRLAEVEYDESQVADAAFDWAHVSGLMWRYAAHPIPWNDDVGTGLSLREKNDPTQVEVWGAIGIAGYYAGPRAQIIDMYALSDPLLARLPIPDPLHEGYWRSGHWERSVPRGYLESMAHGTNEIENQSLHAFYEAVRIVTRGPLFSPRRWVVAAGLGLGIYDHYLKEYLEEYDAKPTTPDALPPMRSRNSDEDADCSSKPKGGYTWHLPCAQTGVRFSNRGVIVRLPGVEHAKTFELDLSAGQYSLAFWHGGAVTGRMPLTSAGGRKSVSAPPEVIAAGYEAVSIRFSPETKRDLSYFRLRE
jgi:arabinofuranosyltransferase